MSQITLSPTLKEALAVHRQGSATRAIPIYERALKEKPENADALSAYGAALVEVGRLAEAEGPIRRAIDLKPDRPGYRLNLAELLFKAGEEEEGVAELKRVNASHPRFAPAFARLGRAYVERQDLPAAADAFDTALQLDPNDHQTALILARALAAMQNYGGAYHVLDHAEKIRADDLEALRFRLEIARTRRDFPAMQNLAERLSKLAPEDATGWRDLAATFFEDGRYTDAVTAFERAMQIIPRNAESLAQLATLAIQALDFGKAEAALNEAESLDPRAPRTLATKALLLTYQGKKAEAEDYCLRCLKADPDYTGVYPQLSLLRGGRLTDEEEAQIRAHSRRDDVPPGSRAAASFVVAHSLDRKGAIDAAFAEYQRANDEAAERNRREDIRYDYAGHSAWTDAIIEVFRGPAPADTDSQHQGSQPIFIVGLPRCGSTLVESVIAAHSAVHAGGELPMAPNLFNAWFRNNHRLGEARLTAMERERLAEAYMRGLPAGAAKARVTDKNLLNHEAAGLLAQIFPRAVIVNVRRNPVENAFSIWRQDMLKFWAYAVTFEDIAKRWGLYARLTDHFERALPGRFHTIQYEDFVTGFDSESKKLIALLGLDWEDQCGDFQKARDVAPTLSAIQVREEVSLKGDRANLYGKRLDPLRRALEAEGLDLATGALRK